MSDSDSQQSTVILFNGEPMDLSAVKSFYIPGIIPDNYGYKPSEELVSLVKNNTTTDLYSDQESTSWFDSVRGGKNSSIFDILFWKPRWKLSSCIFSIVLLFFGFAPFMFFYFLASIEPERYGTNGFMQLFMESSGKAFLYSIIAFISGGIAYSMCAILADRGAYAIRSIESVGRVLLYASYLSFVFLFLVRLMFVFK